MAKGISIHIGVNQPRQCSCNQDKANGPERDAQGMAEIAQERGFSVAPLLLGSDATLENVRAELLCASRRLHPNDLLFLSFSGHGCQNTRGSPCTENCRDETWCLADREMIDDELHECLSRFAPMVRILVVSASCHSGGMSDPRARRRSPGRAGAVGTTTAPALIPLGDPVTIDRDVQIQASVLFLVACADSFFAQDAPCHGEFTLFTRMLVHHWNNGAFKGRYRSFMENVRRSVQIQNNEQVPDWARAGVDPKFWMTRKPFTI